MSKCGGCRSVAREPIRLGFAIKASRRAVWVPTRDVGVVISRSRALVFKLVVEATPVHLLEDLEALGFANDRSAASHARPDSVCHAQDDAGRASAHAAIRSVLADEREMCTVRIMAKTPRGQFRIQLPDGLIIERLPVGLANGSWRLSFVISGAPSIWDEVDHANDVSMFDVFHRRIAVEGLGGVWELGGKSSDGNGREAEYRLEVVGEGVTGLKVTYSHKGETVGSEVIDLVG